MAYKFGRSPGYTRDEMLAEGISAEDADATLARLRADIAQEDAEYVARMLTDYVNSMTFDSAPFAAAMDRQHRTLQQSVFGMFLNWTVGLAAKTDDQYDARNSYAVKVARAMVDGAREWIYISAGRLVLPFI